MDHQSMPLGIAPSRKIIFAIPSLPVTKKKRSRKAAPGKESADWVSKKPRMREFRRSTVVGSKRARSNAASAPAGVPPGATRFSRLASAYASQIA
eukprot:scaffold106882_cov28-Tisochrysis_lutea.AAC.2